MEGIINPGEFTEKELLKLVYRDLHTLRADFDEYKKGNTVHLQFQELQLKLIQFHNQMSTENLQLRNEISIEKELRLESKKQLKMTIYIIAFILTTLSFLLKFYIN